MAQKRKQKRQNSKRWLYWLFMVILFVGAAAVCYYVWDVYFKTKDGGDRSGTEQSAVEERPGHINKGEDGDIDESEDKSGGDETVEKKVVQYEGEDPNMMEELTGAVTYAGVNGDMLTVRVNIDQYLSEGSCRLELSQGGVVAYEDMVGIAAMVTTATCDGFSVPVGELGSGDYDILVELKSGDKNGKIKGEVSL